MRRPARSSFAPRGHQHHIQRIPLSRSPFDVLTAEKFMNRANAIPDDSDFARSMTERHMAIAPTPSAQNNDLIDFMSAVEQAVDDVTINSFSGRNEIREFHRVGSFQTQTMLVGDDTADVVIVLQCLPSRDVLEEVSSAVCNAVKSKNQKFADLEVGMTDSGFVLKTKGAKVQFLACTLWENKTKLDPALHVSRQSLQAAFSAIRHTRWMENNADHGLRILIRLLKDVRNRFPLMRSLTSRMIDVLAYSCLMNFATKPPSTLPLPSAFRRAFQLMASGIFLPGSAGVPDPVASIEGSRITTLSLEQMDDVCRMSQVLCRLLYTNDHHLVFNGTPLDIPADAEEPTAVFSDRPDVVVYPRAYVAQPTGEDKASEKEESQRCENASDAEAVDENGLSADAQLCKVDAT